MCSFFERIVCLPLKPFFAEIVKKELLKVADESFVGFPNLIMAAKVRLALLTSKVYSKLQEHLARVKPVLLCNVSQKIIKYLYLIAQNTPLMLLIAFVCLDVVIRDRSFH